MQAGIVFFWPLYFLPGGECLGRVVAMAHPIVSGQQPDDIGHLLPRVVDGVRQVGESTTAEVHTIGRSDQIKIVADGPAAGQGQGRCDRRTNGGILPLRLCSCSQSRISAKLSGRIQQVCVDQAHGGFCTAVLAGYPGIRRHEAPSSILTIWARRTKGKLPAALAFVEVLGRADTQS